jgi:endonuclease/exonuclease/phosphatase family metal-dependent hydrolase
MLLRLAVCSLALLSCTLGRAEPAGRQLRVLSYNIHHGEGVDGRLDLERIAGVIASAEPDVVALQEVDQGTQRTRRMRQADELARRLNMHVAFGPNLNLEGGEYGNAILSRWPLTAHRNVPLASFDEGEQRGVLIADLAWPAPDGVLRLLATHWDHRRDDRERYASAGRLLELALERSRVPSLLVGDLNTTRDSDVFGRLSEQWAVAGDEPAPTVPVANPIRQIDFVLYRPRDAWRVVQIEVLDEVTASDHRPILAVLELR